MRPFFLWIALMLIAGTLVTASFSYAGTIEVVSMDSSGKLGIGRSYEPSISSDGRYVTFNSGASNLVPDDSNGLTDVFVHDRQSGKTELVSKSSTGIIGDGDSTYPTISSDGRYVTFKSLAGNLVPGVTNGTTHIFVHDRQTGKTEIVSKDSAGKFANNSSDWPTISADGRFVAFESAASNLVPADMNGIVDIFVHDRQTGKTELVSKDDAGTFANNSSYLPSISADGRYVAFYSNASNLVPDDTNGKTDVFVHDRQSGKTELVSKNSAGIQGSGVSSWSSISADGRYAAFYSSASNLVPDDTNGKADVFVHDRQTGKTELVSKNSAGNLGNGASEFPSISADGRYVVFESEANNLSPDIKNATTHIFVHDRQSGTTEIVSVDSSGIHGNAASYIPVMSDDGTYVAFESDASNLVPDDTNGESDIFVYTRN